MIQYPRHYSPYLSSDFSDRAGNLIVAAQLSEVYRLGSYLIGSGGGCSDFVVNPANHRTL